MTLKELHREVSALGFDDFLAFDARFHSAACRALQSIYNAVEVTARTKFFVRSSLPSSRISLLYHKGGGSEVLPLVGKAFSMRLYGKGIFRLTDSKTSIQQRFDCNGDTLRYFINGDATLMLGGDLSYTVCDIVTFDEVFSEDTESIPDGSGYTTVDIRRKVADFLAFVSMPKDKNGRLIESAVLHDGKITFGGDFIGEAELSYRKGAILPSLDAPDAEIDLAAGYKLLLSLLTASYLLLDDDSDKAMYYKSIYEAELDRIKKLQKGPVDYKYTISDGWA